MRVCARAKHFRKRRSRSRESFITRNSIEEELEYLIVGNGGTKGLIYATESSSGGWCTMELRLYALRQRVNSRPLRVWRSREFLWSWKRKLRLIWSLTDVANRWGSFNFCSSNVERNFIDAKKFSGNCSKMFDDKARVSDYIFGVSFEYRINVRNPVIVRQLFARTYKGIGVGCLIESSSNIENTHSTPNRPTPNQCETRCNLQGFGYVTVDELV